MKYVAGCLVGVVLGLGTALFAFFALTFLLPSQKLPLFPAASQGNADVMVTVSDAYITQEARIRMPQLGMANMQNLIIQMHAPNRAETTMDFQIALLGVPLTIHPHAQIHFELQQGRITINVDRVDVAGFNVPQDIVNQQMGAFKQLGEAVLDSELKRGLANTDLHLVGVEATEGSLILKFSH